MWQISGIMILWIFATLNFGNAQVGESKFLYPGEATDEDVKSLKSITSAQALPVISFLNKESEKLQNAMGLIKVEIKNGRLASGTKFFRRPSSPQMFFCPDPSENCLARRKFKESQELECELEPIPILEENPVKKPCGVTGTGTHLRFVYKICPAKLPYSYKSDHIVVYSICYDKPSKEILSAGYELSGAAMLPLRLLRAERDIDFKMNTQTYGLIDDDYNVKLEAEAKLRPKYKRQMLVPIEDMPLATSRKPTRYFANFALQHVDLTNLWDHIRSLIRNHAVEWFDQTFGITTRVFDVPKDETTLAVGDQQMENIWIAVIMDNPQKSSRQLAIMMNNFIVDKSDSNRGKITETSKKLFIDKICDKNLCVDSLKQKFEKFGGEVRCCQVNNAIEELFVYGASEYDELMPGVLHIENITFNSFGI